MHEIKCHKPDDLMTLMTCCHTKNVKKPHISCSVIIIMCVKPHVNILVAIKKDYSPWWDKNKKINSLVAFSLLHYKFENP